MVHRPCLHSPWRHRLTPTIIQSYNTNNTIIGFIFKSNEENQLVVNVIVLYQSFLFPNVTAKTLKDNFPQNLQTVRKLEKNDQKSYLPHLVILCASAMAAP